MLGITIYFFLNSSFIEFNIVTEIFNYIEVSIYIFVLSNVGYFNICIMLNHIIGLYIIIMKYEKLFKKNAVKQQIVSYIQILKFFFNTVILQTQNWFLRI